MPSFIFNSKYSLLQRSLLVFLLLFGAYNIALLRLKPRAVYYQNQWEKNVSIAQEYILDDKPRDIVVVGSSLSARLDEDVLGPRFLNLSFSGGSSATGLEIIRRCPSSPRIVLVETNHLEDLDSTFVRDRFSPLTIFFQRWLPSARVRYKPVNLLLGILRGNDKTKEVPPDSAVFSSLFAAEKESFSTPPDSIAFQKSIARVKETVDALSKRNIQVVFFQMPIHPDLVNSPWSMAAQGEIRKDFPPPHYGWLQAIPGDYATSDGIHLLQQSARLFSARLRDQIEAQLAP